MGYHGHLRIGEEATPGLAVRIDIGDESVVVFDSNEVLGSWDADDVTIQRLQGDLFQLQLAEETFEFIAADRLSFGYDGVQRLAEAQFLLNKGLRGRLRRKRRDARPSPRSLNPVSKHLADAEYEAPVTEISEAPPPASAAAVFARGYSDPADLAEPPAPVPVDQEDSSFWTEPDAAEISRRQMNRDEVMAARVSTGEFAELANGKTTPLSEKLIGSLGNDQIPALPGRAQEDIRSPRLEKEAAIPHAKPPADPWDPSTGHDRPAASPANPPNLDISEAPEAPKKPPAAPPRQPSSPPKAPSAPSPDPKAPVTPEAVDTTSSDASADPADSLAEQAPSTNTATQPDEAQVVIDLTESPNSRTLKGRFRMRKRHEHTYSEDTVSGGIVRRVCSECHHVSIGAP